MRISGVRITQLKERYYSRSNCGRPFYRIQICILHGLRIATADEKGRTPYRCDLNPNI